MSDLDEPVGKNMKQKPSDKLLGVHRHDLGIVVVCVVSPPERDFVVFELHDPVVADCDPVGISAKIFKNTLSPIKGRFTVDDPLLFIQVGD